MTNSIPIALRVAAVAALISLPLSAQDHPFETDTLREPRLDAGSVCLIQGATVHTAKQPAFVGDVLVKDGKITAVGEGLEAPAGAVVIDATGMHLAPGVVDCHSHMGIDRGVNEGSLSITAEVRIRDSVNVDDVGLYRALGGGVTTIRQLHGSANAIGGQDSVIKLRWGGERTAEDLLVTGAETGIKFALGENPKRRGQQRFGSTSTPRFPGTRMGIESIYYRAFTRAQEYAAEWQAYEDGQKAGSDPAPPRKDIRLDTLAGIIAGDVHVHSHSYRADEILMLVRASEAFGFRIATLQHVLEGYKVAHELAEAGVGASAFSDWWAYKIEAYDAVPQAASLMHDAGVLTSINSDSAEMVRRLYAEAAKSVRYANMDPVAALGLVTLFPAMQLGLGERIGSLEVGKDADMALMNGDPMSSLTRVEWTMVDGVIEFERRDAFAFGENPVAVAELDEGTPQVEYPADAKFTALVGGTLHTVTGDTIENGTLLMVGRHIVAVGEDIEVPDGAEVHDVSGKHVWPGMIALSSTLGIHEIGQVPATVDTSEIGGNQPDLRVTASINADSVHLGIARWNGITRAQVTPQSRGPLRGQSAVIDLDGDTWEELLSVDRDMLHVSFPFYSNLERDDGHEHGSSCDEVCGHTTHFDDCWTASGPPALAPQGFRRGGGAAAKRGADGQIEENQATKDLRKILADAREYGRLRDLAHGGVGQAPQYDPRMDAVVPFARGEKRVALHADTAQSILMAAKFAHEEDLDAVIYGGKEAWKVVDVLAQLKLPVVVGPTWSTPSSRFDPYDCCFANAAALARAGVPFAICTQDTDNERNLPFQAATAAAYGLPVEEAVRAVTFYPARILGLEDQLGSLVPGKLADVIVTDGHLLEITAPATHVFIEGRLVDHRDNKHVNLYERYRARLQRLQGK